MIAGINYPWSVFQGRPNYGCDFGRNQWNSHAGVTRHLDEVRADFEAMAAGGAEVARWFVFTDGRGGVAWTESGELAGIGDGFDEDMAAALDIAAATGVRLCLVLVDFAWLDDPVRRAALLTSAFVDRVLDPFLDRAGLSAVIATAFAGSRVDPAVRTASVTSRSSRRPASARTCSCRCA